MSEKGGGPAFPVSAGFSPECGTMPGHCGMSLRDWFAGMALQSIIRVKEMRFLPENDAGWAYKIADAMLAEREKARSSGEK